MIREDALSASSSTNEAPTLRSSGRHDRAGYVRRLVALWRSGKSGVFQVRFGRRRLKIFILSGAAVACRTYLESDEERTVQVAGPEGVGAALSWATGDWVFQPMPGASVHVDPDLQPRTSLAELWHSVLKTIPASEAMVAVSERGDDIIEPGPDLADCFPLFEALAPLDGLVETLGEGATVDSLFRAFPDDGPDLARMVWMLEAAGLFDPDDIAYIETVRGLMDVQTYDEPPSISLIGKSPSAVSRASARRTREPRPRRTPRPAPQNPSRDLAGILKAEHDRRMGRDYYGFLGVAANAPQLLVNRLCKRYLQRWRSASSNGSLPQEAQALAQELFAAITQVSDVLTEPARREDYDQLLARGAAPLITADSVSGVRLIPPAGSPARDEAAPTTAYGRGRLLLERGEYVAAARYLEKARQQSPSEADVLADLGWACWMLQGSDDAPPIDADDPEEYIQLALTFDKSNRRALEYLARIAMAGEDLDFQQARLKELLRVVPDTEWAREALKSLMFTRKESASSESGRGLLFWRKGNSH